MKLATDALAGVLSFFGIQSEQKLHDVSKDLPDAIQQGVQQGVPDMVQSIEDLSSLAITAMTGVIGQIADAINMDMDMAPSIRPVVDMSSIIAGGQEIDRIFANRNLNLAATTGQISMISSNMPGNNALEGTHINQADQKGQTVSFTQNNYSPKALSRIEIYRQTKNQLRALKGLV